MKAKENIRIWFEFYKLALSDQRFKKEINESRIYYSQWGDIKNIQFDKWWLTHKELFDEVTIREINEIDSDPSAIFLKVPLALPLTDLMARFRVIVEDKQGQFRGKQTKTKAVAISKYSFTLGTEFRAKKNNDVLMIYRDIYLKNGRPPINNVFILKMKEFYENRRSKKNNKLPIVFASFDPHETNETIIRNCRRYIKDAEKLMLAAAKGDFPGRD